VQRPLITIDKLKRDKQMKKMLQTIATVSIMLSATFANASTILTANNADVDFVVIENFDFLVAVFATENDLATASNPETVDFNNFIPGFFGSPNLVSGEVMIGANNNFVVGISNDGGTSWIADSGYSGGTTGIINFSIAGSADAGVLLVDVQQVASVPVPAAIWLFGAGLIGLTRVARRKLS